MTLCGILIDYGTVKSEPAMNIRGQRLHWLLAAVLVCLLGLSILMVCARVFQVNSARSELGSRGISCVVLADNHAWLRGIIPTSAEEALWGVTSINSNSSTWVRGPLTDADWNAALPLLEKLPTILLISIESAEITQQTLQSFSRFPDLNHVLLRGSDLTDEDLSALASLPNLQSLDLSNTQVTGTGLRSLSSLPQLKHLNLDGAPITEEGLAAVATLKQLESISLSNVGLAESDIGQLEEAIPGVMISDD